MRASAVIYLLNTPSSHFQHSIASKCCYPIDHLFAISEIHPFRNRNQLDSSHGVFPAGSLRLAAT